MPEPIAVDEAVEPAHWSPCSFCGTPVPFKRFEIAGGPFWGLQAMVPGAGSDHLASWCDECGPVHRQLH